jgi:hypothetical protein
MSNLISKCTAVANFNDYEVEKEEIVSQNTTFIPFQRLCFAHYVLYQLMG